jgi:hypothetical protein
MPRISEDARSVVLPSEAALPTDYPPPPPALGEREAVEWRAVLQRMGPELLPRETHPLLMAYCAIKVQLDQVHQALAAFGPIPEDRTRWQRFKELTSMRTQLAHQLASLSIKLRIAPSARTDRHLVGAVVRRRGARPAPWAAPDDEVEIQ